MFSRIQMLIDNHSLFLFGARGSGKSTLLANKFAKENCMWIDLLNLDEEEKYARNPMILTEEVIALSETITHVIIDEVQKLPKLLDVVHSLIENAKINKQFILTGSSARKLKRGSANLLAGRAFIFHLFPLTFTELGSQFAIDDVLHWGSLPKLYEYKTDLEKRLYLKSYAQTYLKEEIWGEQIVRNLDPFRKFLEVSAQSNGKIINYAKISRDVGADPKTVKEYFSILEDTLIGFTLESYHNSFRKRLSKSPKFYFFDIGVTRALAQLLQIPVKPGTSYYGEIFEHFVIVECMRLSDYYQKDFKFSYLLTKDGLEIDLVVERPGLPLLLIEIKSSQRVMREDLRNLITLSKEIESEAVCFSQGKRKKLLDSVSVYPWQEGIEQFFN